MSELAIANGLYDPYSNKWLGTEEEYEEYKQRPCTVTDEEYAEREQAWLTTGVRSVKRPST